MARKSLFCLVALAISLVCSSVVFAQNQGSRSRQLGRNRIGRLQGGGARSDRDDYRTARQPEVEHKLSRYIPLQWIDTRFLFGQGGEEGFKTTVLPGVDVCSINNTATVNVTLELGAVTTTVEVTSSAEAVDPTASSINSNLTDESFFNTIPVQSGTSRPSCGGWPQASFRAWAPEAGTMGTAVGSASTDANPSISGASGLENLYVADGVVLNDPSYGGLGRFLDCIRSLGRGHHARFRKGRRG